MMGVRGKAGAKEVVTKTVVKANSVEEDEALLIEAAMLEKIKNKWRDPAQMSTPLGQKYARFAQKAHQLCESDDFNNFIIICIMVAGLNVGVQTYLPDCDTDEECQIKTRTPSSEYWTYRCAKMTDDIVLYIFTFETVAKIVAEGWRPLRFFTGDEWKWNNFDFVIVFCCMPFMRPYLGTQVALLRLMRLMRVAKIVRKVPQLQMIVMGLVGGMKSIVYIVILLVLIFYLFAVTGIYLFGANDPWHFGDLATAMLTLFRCATLEDWTDVMYINIYGCHRYGGGIYAYDKSTQRGWSYATFSKPDDWPGLFGNDYDIYIPRRWKCIPSLPKYLPDDTLNPEYDPETAVSPFASVLFFVFFTIISALVMLSLFVGAVTMSMTSSMEDMKVAAAEAARIKRIAKGKQQAEKDAANAAAGGVAGEGDEGKETNVGLTKKDREKLKMKKLMTQAWEGNDLEHHDENEDEDAMIQARYAGRPIRGAYARLAAWMLRLTEQAFFSGGITGVIIIGGILVGIQTDEKAVTAYEKQFEMADEIILIIFTVEIFCKVVAEDGEPLNFLYTGALNSWNCFDLFVVLGSYGSNLGDGSQQSLLTMLRLLRLLRVLKLVKSLPQLQVIVTALIMGLNSIGFIAIILFIFFYVFAIIGMIMFKENDPWHFGTLHISLLTLFRCATLEDWTDVMYINMHGCAKYGYAGMPDKCDAHAPQGWLATLYFIIFIVIGALVLFTLFIGVVTTSMEEATSDMKEAQEVEAKVKAIMDEEKLSDDVVELYRTVFGMLDLDDGGTIEEEELKIGLSAVGKHCTEDEIKEMLSAVDEDNSGEIDFAEFLQFMLNMKNHNEDDEDDDEMALVDDPAAAAAGGVGGFRDDSGNGSAPPAEEKEEQQQSNPQDAVAAAS